MDQLNFWLLCGAGFGIWTLFKRLKEAEDRFETLSNSRPWRSDIDGLSVRIALLEAAGTRVEQPAPRPDPEPEWTTAAPIIIEPVIPVQILEESRFTEPARPEVEAPHIHTPAFIPEPTPQQPTLAEQFRVWLKATELESFVGVSLLNKIGAVLLVIGIALFLGYSFGHIGAAGRAVSAIAASAALLAAGVRTESRPRFAVFARGLIGAGWAALYATAYAIYAVPATQVIASPFVGSVLLFAVACGMIAHSLRYRAQAVTAVTYFAAFAALAVNPATPFAVLSLIPLAASLLYLAWRFNWLSMALAGTAATYLTCISRGDAHAALAASQALMLAYWLLFEAFDLMRMKRRLAGGGVEWIFPANAVGFLGLSCHAWATHAPEHLWLASACGAALYLASAAARFVVRPPSSFANGELLEDRVIAGSMEGSALIAAVLAGLAIFGHGTEMWASVELLVEAEIVYLAGVALGSGFLRGVGVAGFGVSILRCATLVNGAGSTVLGHSFNDWSPVAMLHALVFYFNREVGANNDRRRGTLFSSVAALLVSIAIYGEVQQDWVGLALAIFGTLLWVTGVSRKLAEFRFQGFALMMLGFAGTAFTTWKGDTWTPVAICLALAYGLACSIEWTAGESDGPEYLVTAQASAGAVAALAAILLWRVIPDDYLGTSLALLMVTTLELGIRRLPGSLRSWYRPIAGICILSTVTTYGELHHLPPMSIWLTYLVDCACFAACAIRLAMTKSEDERDIVTIPALAAAGALVWLVAPLPLVSVLWLALGLAVIELSRKYNAANLTLIGAAVAVAGYARVLGIDMYDPTKVGGVPAPALTGGIFIAGIYTLWSQMRDMNWTVLARIASWSAPVLFMALTLQLANANDLALWWIGGALALLVVYRIRPNRDFRFQGYGLSGVAFLAAGYYNLWPVTLTISISVVAAFYAARFVVAREGEKRGPLYFSVAGSLLLAAVLFNAVSGGMLTVAWGIEGAGLLCAGFMLRDRAFRLQGLALALACTLKLFLYDLRNLETPYRIVSFIVLGGILLGVSWVYSRFREQLRQIL